MRVCVCLFDQTPLKWLKDWMKFETNIACVCI